MKSVARDVLILTDHILCQHRVCTPVGRSYFTIGPSEIIQLISRLFLDRRPYKTERQSNKVRKLYYATSKIIGVHARRNEPTKRVCLVVERRGNGRLIIVTAFPTL